MKALFLIACTVLVFSISALKAQKKAQQDNNQFISVVQTQKTLGRSNFTHYTLTNNSSVAMDFTLYKESKDGTWLTTHSLNLNPGQTFDDESSASTLTGKYVVYSAPNSDWASFPSFRDIAALQGNGSGSNAVAPAPPAPTPAITPAPPVLTPPVTPAVPSVTPQTSVAKPPVTPPPASAPDNSIPMMAHPQSN